MDSLVITKVQNIK